MENILKNFYTLEGGEGVGKTTVALLMKKTLEEKGYEVVLTREPGGEKIAEKIREIILNNELDIKTEVLLFAAARCEHINNIIIPALKANKIVICDRYFDSSIIYQQYVQNANNVKEINDYVVGDIIPNKTFLLNLDPKIALQRIHKDNREKNRYDLKELEFHQKIYDSYQEYAQNIDRIIKIDANTDAQTISERILSYMEIKE